MPESLVPVPQWKKDRCKRCAEETALTCVNGIPQHIAPGYQAFWDCTAPTESVYMADLEARLKESAKDTARLDAVQRHHEEICSWKVTSWRYAYGNLEPISVKADGRNCFDTPRAAIDAARGVKP